METAKVVQLQDDAYFIVDSFSFYGSGITSYDPFIANQTIIPSWVDPHLLEAEEPLTVCQEKPLTTNQENITSQPEKSLYRNPDSQLL
jgi:hypothetical protein